jgi:hypothetical protein
MEAATAMELVLRKRTFQCFLSRASGIPCYRVQMSAEKPIGRRCTPIRKVNSGLIQ